MNDILHHMLVNIATETHIMQLFLIFDCNRTIIPGYRHIKLANGNSTSKFESTELEIKSPEFFLDWVLELNGPAFFILISICIFTIYHLECRHC